MNLNSTPNITELVIAILSLIVFGILYNLGIEKWKWLAQLRPAEQVVIGVFITVLTSGFFIGWENVIIVFAFFAASGGPMIIGSWVRAARDATEAKEITKETLR